MNNLLQTKKKEEYIPTYGEISEYVKSKQLNLDEDEILAHIHNYPCLFELNEENQICALVIYNLLPDKSGHHIYFFGADSKIYRRKILIQVLQHKCWPKQSLRRGKVKIYNKPERLIRRLLTKG